MSEENRRNLEYSLEQLSENVRKFNENFARSQMIDFQEKDAQYFIQVCLIYLRGEKKLASLAKEQRYFEGVCVPLLRSLGRCLTCLIFDVGNPSAATVKCCVSALLQCSQLVNIRLLAEERSIPKNVHQAVEEVINALYNLKTLGLNLG